MLTRSFIDAVSRGPSRGGLAAALCLGMAVLTGACGSDDSKPGAGDGGIDPARATVAGGKFCNNLVAQSGPLTLTLEIGSPPVRLTAVSGKCSVEKGTACANLTSGLIPWKLVLDGQTVLTGSSEIMNGEQRIFVADLNSATRQPTVLEGILQDNVQCRDFDPFDEAVPAGDGGAPPPPGPGRP